MSSVKVESLTKQYGNFCAVESIDFEVKSGEIFGFLGPNGAGKSTTIDMLLDFVRPTSGNISVLGFNPQRNPQAVRQRTGILPEAYGYYEKATAREHVEFAIKMKHSADNPATILERVGIADYGNQPVGAFSKGMRQRLGLGLALVDEPELLILDEPLSGLDPTGARLLQKIVRTERNRGATVFFSSHIMDKVETVCDRVAIMSEGNIIAVDSISQLRDRIETPSTFSVTVDTVPRNHDLLEVKGVADLDTKATTLEFECTSPSAKHEIVNRIGQYGVQILDIDNQSGDLEQLFMEVTDVEEKT